MLRSLLLAGLTLAGIVLLLIALACCYLSFATNDYRPILATAVGAWLFGSACFGLVYGLDGKTRRLVFCLWAGPSGLVWLELARRGPVVFLGLQ